MVQPRDGFERYFAEKLWDWVPEVHRYEDGKAINPDVLRSLIEIAGYAAATARRSVDRLWEDQFPEFCDDWALPYIGDLVGTRLVNALNRRGRRADVVRTIFYRRRKGTLTVLQMLVRDIAGWDGVVVEAFRRLGRTPHRLDAALAGDGAIRIGHVTGTPPGGFADLRCARGSDLVDGPFDEYSHAADVRQLRGHLGRYNIPKLNFHLYRQLAFEIRFATAVDFGSGRFTFDPSGRDTVLFRRSPQFAPSFQPGLGDDDCAPIEEWRVTAPIPCRLLGEARYTMKASDIPAGLETQLSPLIGITFADEALLRRTLGTLLTPAQFAAAIYPILASAITPDSAKLHLYPDAVAVSIGADNTAPVLPRERATAANLEDWGALLGLYVGKELAVDPPRGRFLLLQPPLAGTRVFAPVHFVGLFGPLGALTYDRRDTVKIPNATTVVHDLANGGIAVSGPVTGAILPVPATGIHQFVDSKTYEPNSPPGGTYTGIDALILQAANFQRPYIRLVPDGGGNRWTFQAAPKLNPTDSRILELDGLWLGVLPQGLAPQAVADETVPATPVPVVIAIDGVFDQVVIRHCNLDPGGEQARTVPTQVMPIPAVQLEITGQVEEVRIEQSIVGPVREAVAIVDPCSAARIVIRDSVVQSILPGTRAIETRVAAVVIERSTVFGDVVVDRLDASEALIQGLVQVTDNQHGCFRFSATHDGATVRLPRQFESHLFTPGIPNHFFVSRRFGDAGYAQLSETAPDTIARGAENGSEIGVWSGLLTPIKADDLKAKVLEFMPFGLIPQFIEET
jgi:hypothetical protein